jgi:MarR family transcriptional regulator, lower aerobic nicotinate degradation pathway regulator
MHSAPDAHGFMALDAIRKLVRVLGESARLAQGRTGITGAQLFVLRVLADHPSLSINELAERTMTHQSSVSAVVSRLVERGLVTRAPAPDDRRRQLVTLTPRGRALRRTAPAVAQEVLVQAIRGLAPARRRALAVSLRALTDALGVSEQTAPMFFEEDDRQRNVAPRRRRSSVNVHA